MPCLTHLTQSHIFQSQLHFFGSGMGKIQPHDFHTSVHNLFERFFLFRCWPDGCYNLGQLMAITHFGGIGQIECSFQGTGLFVDLGNGGEAACTRLRRQKCLSTNMTSTLSSNCVRKHGDIGCDNTL